MRFDIYPHLRPSYDPEAVVVPRPPPPPPPPPRPLRPPPPPQRTYTNRASDLSFQSRRSPVLATRGMVACSQPLAAEAGLSILKSGGNAIDAAIAVAAALAVTEPCSTGLGGDCFILYYERETKRVHSMNGSGRSPKTLTPEALLSDCFDQPPADLATASIPKTHAHTVTVPGAAAGWMDALERWGSMDAQVVLSRAIELADAGWPVTPITAFHWANAEPLLNAGGARSLLVDDAHDAPAEGSPAGGSGGGGDASAAAAPRAPRAGELFTNRPLAETLRSLALGGKDAFYSGRIADAIVASVVERGGLMSVDDLKHHAEAGSEFGEAIHTHYHGIDVYEHPPNGQV